MKCKNVQTVNKVNALEGTASLYSTPVLCIQLNQLVETQNWKKRPLDIILTKFEAVYKL